MLEKGNLSLLLWSVWVWAKGIYDLWMVTVAKEDHFSFPLWTHSQARGWTGQVNLVVLFYGWMEHDYSICIPASWFRYVYWLAFFFNIMFDYYWLGMWWFIIVQGYYIVLNWNVMMVYIHMYILIYIEISKLLYVPLNHLIWLYIYEPLYIHIYVFMKNKW